MANQKQVDLLRQGVKVWNIWRGRNPSASIDFSRTNLQGAHLSKANLSKANLSKANLFSTDLSSAKLLGANLKDAHLEGADLSGADLSSANLKDAHLEGADLSGADLSGADLSGANLLDANLLSVVLKGVDLLGPKLFRTVFECANLSNLNLLGTNLLGTNLSNTNFKGAIISYKTQIDPKWRRVHHIVNGVLREKSLINADLSSANLSGADLRNTDLSGANLSGADLTEADIRNTTLDFAIVDGTTLLIDCEINDKTSVHGVGLDSARIQESLKAKLKKNIRKKYWEEKYPLHIDSIFSKKFWCSCIVRVFWWISDYGSSTRRIIWTFFWVSILFSSLYLISTPASDWVFGPQTEIYNPFVKGIESHPFWPRVLRAIYFSVVTMTTLGSGGITLHLASPLGHVLVMFQVLIGYILLVVLITRLSILFQDVG